MAPAAMQAAPKRADVLGTAKKALRALAVVTALLRAAAAASTGGCSATVSCKNMGTCQVNSGVCSCPLGYGGPLCEELLWPACRIINGTTAQGRPASMYCENWLEPRNCYCVQQCMTRRPSLGQYYEDRACFTWDGVPVEEQLSTYPQDAKRAAHFADYYKFRESRGEGKIPVEEYVERRKKHSHLVLHNINACPNQCSGEGNCLAQWEGAAPGCGCFFARTGDTCESDHKELGCYSNCSGHGTCIRGYCSCETGWFGLDCSIDLSKTTHFQDRTTFPKPEDVPHELGWDTSDEQIPPYAGEYTEAQRARRAHPSKLRIYMYELPSWLNLASETDAQRIAGHYNQRDRGIYCAYNLFTEQFLPDTFVRTFDPYEANLFYVPLLPYGTTENGREGAYLAMRAVSVIRRQWPFWDRFKGADHFFFAMQDAGECHGGYRDGRIPPMVRDVIWLSHWGAVNAGKHPEGGESKWARERCFETEHHIVISPGLKDMHKTAIATFGDGRLAGAGSGAGAGAGAAGDADDGDGDDGDTGGGGAGGGQLVGNDAKDTLLMFAGNVDFNWLQYSQGVRQRAFITYGHKQGFDINDGYVNRVNGHRSYDESMRHSLFCLAVAGGGWGQRLISAIVDGCIPVVIMDNVRQPNDDVLPYHEFSVRVTQDEMDDLEGILRAIPPKRIRQLQKGVRKWHRYFYWGGDGLAYNATLMSLQQKAWNVLALYPGR